MIRSYPAFMVHDVAGDTYLTFTKRTGQWVQHERPAVPLLPEYDHTHEPQLYIHGTWLLLAAGEGVDYSRDDGATWQSTAGLVTDHMWAEGLLPRDGTAYSVLKERTKDVYDYAADAAPFRGTVPFHWDCLFTPGVIHVRWYTSMIINGTIYVLWTKLME